MNRRLLISVLFCGIMALCNAQQNNDDQQKIFEEAQSEYTVGRVENARDVLSKSIAKFRGSLRQDAYRLLSLCCIAIDDDERAEVYTRQLLADNPYYTTSASDPMRFKDIVERIKNGMSATITTASSQAEKLEESPVPVTLITEEMIHDCGARNLKEVLLSYVPGMTSVDSNDDINVAMRGTFSLGQEKMLIMLNGHRLNSYSTNTSAPDFSISLEKIKQIEVLRGPSSSLYGGVALTAVVNIITKSGRDVDGLDVKAGLGNYGQWRGDAVFGKRYFDLDVFVWGGLYKADGEKAWVDAKNTGLKQNSGNIYIGKVGNKPTHDFGVTLRYKDFQLLYNNHFSQIVSPYTVSYTFSPYTLSKFTTYRGQKPGFSVGSQHSELLYGHQFTNRLYLSANVTYDNIDMVHYQVVTDSAFAHLGALFGSDKYNDVLNKPGVYRYLDGHEHTFGTQLKGDYNYMNSKEHNGFISFGAHWYRFSLDDIRYLIGGNFSQTIIDGADISTAAKGHESGIDGFVQLKHHWKQFIFNAGLRYDFKKHFNDSKINEWSPRIALIYLQPKWNVKLSYSKSFVDAPYLYRMTNIAIVKRDDELKSEYLHSIQLTLSAPKLLNNLQLELNGFYNRATNMIYPYGLYYDNAGTSKSVGTELTARYKIPKFTADVIFTWQHVISCEYFGYNLDCVYNVPDVSANAVLVYRPVNHLKLYSNINLYGNQTSYTVDILNNNKMETEKVNPRCLLNLGCFYDLKGMELGLDFHNIMNHKYCQGGINTGLLRQQGRWFTFSIGYKF